MILYHYFEKARGPFLTVSDLSHDEAVKVFEEFKTTNQNMVPPDINWFLHRRRELESKVRDLFIKKGGKPLRNTPHYMTVGDAPTMNTWYIEPECLKININEFDLDTVSFTYGDMFPVFNPRLDKGEEFRNNVYRYDEIIELIDKYGYPQDLENNISPSDLKYIEAHIWSDEIIEKYRKIRIE